MVREAGTLDDMPLFGRRSEPRPVNPAPTRRPAVATAGDRDDRELDWRGYDDVAEDYLRVAAPRMEVPARELVDLLEPVIGWRALDVGTGTGVVARELARREGVRAVGVDLAPEMVLAAHRVDGGAAFAAAAAIDLPFRDGTFDAVTAAFVLSHFARYETALFDMLRVLRPGGRMGVTAWGPGKDEFVIAWNEVAQQFAELEILRDARQRAMPWDERFSDPNRLKDALYEAGLRHLRVERREYRFEMTAEDYLTGREIAATGRFLRTMLGEELWQRFRARTREVFAERFPQTFHDFRDVNVAVGTKPA
jgi:ubiquinone/menaquinone biosynthesis C-methylase UbiE